jgi:ABC-type transport system involved in cytochrome bd biosynthesis fused ATPase/permease subunit
LYLYLCSHLQTIAATSNILLQLPTLGDHLVTLHTIHCFESLFTETASETLSASFYSDLVAALLEVKPAQSDPQSALSYIKVLTKAVEKLYRYCVQ